MKLNLMMVLVVFSLLFSCKSTKDATTQTQAETQASQSADPRLLGGKWQLEYMTPVDGKNVSQLFKIQKPFLRFVDENKVAGNNGCNNISGGYEINGNKIQFFTDKFASTRMVCEGFKEEAFTGILKTINNYEIINDGSKLILLTSDIMSMTFVRVEE